MRGSKPYGQSLGRILYAPVFLREKTRGRDVGEDAYETSNGGKKKRRATKEDR